ncbi:GNAT family N-acetyltransferase [Mycobacterium sp. NPDC003323]
MTIRPATIEDATAIETIVTTAYAPYVARIGREPAPMTVDYRDLIHTADNTHVLVEGGAVVGVLVIVMAADHLLVENVAVDPRHHGKGYGRLLLNFAETSARRAGLTELRLCTNAAMTENLALYPRLGYAEVRRRTEHGFHRVFFRKDLIPPAPR